MQFQGHLSQSANYIPFNKHHQMKDLTPLYQFQVKRSWDNVGTARYLRSKFTFFQSDAFLRPLKSLRPGQKVIPKTRGC